MSTRPSNSDFFAWARKGQNMSNMQNALRAHPDLANIKNWVSFNQICFRIIIFFILIFILTQLNYFVNNHNGLNELLS